MKYQNNFHPQIKYNCMEEDDDEPDISDYEFMSIMDDKDMFYVPTDQNNPNVIVKLDRGDYYLWTPLGLFLLTPTPVDIVE